MNKYTYVYYTATTQFEIERFISRWREKGYEVCDSDPTRKPIKIVMRKENK